jgi:hypothetical protein
LFLSNLDVPIDVIVDVDKENPYDHHLLNIYNYAK